MLRLFDTANGKIVEITPKATGQFSMYVCGPTVYDLAHLGHGRYALVFDILRRYLQWCGLNVVHVSNITDVDDKILDRARAENRSPGEVASEFEEKWFDTMGRLGVLRPHYVPHATEYISRMISAISEMLDLKVAYLGDDGVYFDTSSIPNYGLLARQTLDSLMAGARIEAKEFKKSPTDFVLWKFAEKSDWGWESPWGLGRPGWHTECVVMSVDILGEEFDLHGGGLDLSFPHHENERAQAKALHYGFSRFWMHNGFVMVGNDKMSKSLGNFTTLDELLTGTDARAYRLLVLQSHYRSPLEINPQTIAEASRALLRIDNTFQRLIHAGLNISDAELMQDVLAEFRDQMDNDLDTPGVTSLMFELRSRINQALDNGDYGISSRLGKTLMNLLNAVGIVPKTDDGDKRPSEVEDLIGRRKLARENKDFKMSDQIRDELQELGYLVEDTSTGQRIKKLDNET